MRRVIHAAALGFANLAALLAGFAAYRLLGAADQIAVQAPVAAVSTVAIFAAWLGVSTRVAPGALGVAGARDGVWIYGLAPAWAAAAFVPVHFITQGYLTSFGNVAALWAFQLAVNAAAVPIGFGAARRKAGESRRDARPARAAGDGEAAISADVGRR
jgi:hypothetical protein